MSSRAHGAPAGCPLCKAPADASGITPLWPNDASDFNLYVARHIGDNDQVLGAACEFIFSMQSYMMAAHGVRAAALTRSHRAAERAIDSIVPEQAATELRTGLERLANVVNCADEHVRRLAARHDEVARQARALDEAHAALEHSRSSASRRTTLLDRQTHHLKQKHKQVLAAHERLMERAAELDDREERLAAESATVNARAQDALSASKAASMEEIRRAALREATAAERERQASERAREAEERASDALAALAETRTKNQRMGDQMRELQSALRDEKEKRRSERRSERPDQDRGQRAFHERKPLTPAKRTAQQIPADDDSDDSYPMPGFGTNTSPKTKNAYTIHVSSRGAFGRRTLR